MVSWVLHEMKWSVTMQCVGEANVRKREGELPRFSSWRVIAEAMTSYLGGRGQRREEEWSTMVLETDWVWLLRTKGEQPKC